MIKTFQDDVEMSQSDKEEDEEEEEEEEGEEEEDEDELFSDEGEGSYDEDEDEQEENPHDTFKQDTAKNSQLAVGFKDRSYVVRGDKIGVFKHNERDGLDFATTIKNIKNKAGRDINPSRVSCSLLHRL